METSVSHIMTVCYHDGGLFVRAGCSVSYVLMTFLRNSNACFFTSHVAWEEENQVQIKNAHNLMLIRTIICVMLCDARLCSPTLATYSTTPKKHHPM